VFVLKGYIYDDYDHFYKSSVDLSFEVQMFGINDINNPLNITFDSSYLEERGELTIFPNSNEDQYQLEDLLGTYMIQISSPLETSQWLLSISNTNKTYQGYDMQLYAPNKLTIQAGSPFTFVVEVLSRYEKEVIVDGSSIDKLVVTNSDYNRINYVSIHETTAGVYTIVVTAISTDQELSQSIEVTVLPSSLYEI
jgi:hypothetical protein